MLYEFLIKTKREPHAKDGRVWQYYSSNPSVDRMREWFESTLREDTEVDTITRTPSDDYVYITKWRV